MDIQIQKLEKHEIETFIRLIRVFEEVFEMKDFKMPRENYLQTLLGKDGFFVFVALLDKQVIGGLTSYLMHQYYAESPMVYIFDLAVKNEYQRLGVGKKLIASHNNYCKEIGAEFVMVQADEADGYAIDFYRSTGGRSENVIHFDYVLNLDTSDKA